jgi:hypothetical protein
MLSNLEVIATVRTKLTAFPSLYTLYTTRQVCFWFAHLTQCKSNNLMYRNSAVCLQQQLSGQYKMQVWIFPMKQNKLLTWFKCFEQKNKWIYLRKSTVTSYLGQDQIWTKCTNCLLPVNIFSENKLKNKHILVRKCLWTETSIKMTCTRRYMQVDPLHQFQQQQHNIIRKNKNNT